MPVRTTAWLSRKAGKQYRLPSEAEWEYAARAKTTTARYWGDDFEHAMACGYANVADDTLRKKDNKPPDKSRYFACDDGYANTSPVGSFQPNKFELYDMLGNVWQWTADSIGTNNHGSDQVTGRHGQVVDCGLRVLRGGSWDDDPGTRAPATATGDRRATGAAISVSACPELFDILLVTSLPPPWGPGAKPLDKWQRFSRELSEQARLVQLRQR